MSETKDNSYIRQFWIINRDGLSLFHRSNLLKTPEETPENAESKDNLISGMFSALMTFSKELTKSDIKKFEGNGFKVLFFSEQNLLFVVETALGVADKKVQKKMEIIKESFVKKYSKQLAAFTGEMSAFKTFEEDLDKLFKKISIAEEWGNQLAGLQL